MRIFLIRHGQSEGNVDNTAHQRIADHAISLTPRGEEQARQMGRVFGDHLNEASSKLRTRIWTSPYRRARQTTENLLSGIEVQSLIWDVRENPLLVEQQRGLYDGILKSEYAKEFPRETAHYQKQVAFEGKFWAPCPMGESRFDVAQRVHQAFGTFHRDADRHGIESIAIVSHGVTLRCFAMMWLHKPFEWIEEESNPQNCSIRLIEDGEDKGYVFEGFTE